MTDQEISAMLKRHEESINALNKAQQQLLYSFNTLSAQMTELCKKFDSSVAVLTKLQQNSALTTQKFEIQLSSLIKERENQEKRIEKQEEKIRQVSMQETQEKATFYDKMKWLVISVAATSIITSLVAATIAMVNRGG